ncbi:MAG: DNA-binding transcriptional regulator, MarR family, partial [Marmoricola sp.]|nr:DNA-binding transcriptional regulator, MarR family [Marmoricola sp.]
MGLLTRSRGSDDERLMIIGVTPAGRELEGAAAGVVTEICEAAGLPEGEQADLVRVLRELTTRLEGSTALTVRSRRRAG